MKRKVMKKGKIADIKEMLDRLKALRKEKNLGQEYIAEQLGIDSTTYIEKENGLIPMTIKEWLQISNIAEVKLLYFLKDNS
ncbi:MAG: helix-turn-helix transcriptional regulator [Deltaproteobacteria bacterium]|nr:helix-turn-helix transcriptional regulator [Deltaproteobacteria bacterium]